MYFILAYHGHHGVTKLLFVLLKMGFSYSYQLLLVLLEIIEYITEIRLKSEGSSAFYCRYIFDQKAISPGAALYDEKIYGIIPSLSQEDAHNICKHVITSILNCLISKFKKGD